MSFISSFKRALGFPDEFDGDEEDLDDELSDDLIDDPDPGEDDHLAGGDGAINLSNESPTEPLVDSEELQAVSNAVFDAALAYFNTHQPDLVQRCIDIDTQRELVVQSISSDLRGRLDALADTACRKGESRWAEKQQRLGAELNKLKSEFNAARQQREEYQSAQLSATRQKRALTDRIRDLENQVMTLEAEREQYQLENKSMANRLRNADTPVVQLQDSGNSSGLKAENSSLKEEIAGLKERLQESENEIKRLSESAVQQSESDAHHDLAEELKEMEAQLTPLRQLKDAAEAKVIALTKEMKESDATISTLQKRISENAHVAEQTKLEIEELKSTIEKNLYSHAEIEAELRNEILRLKESAIAQVDNKGAAETAPIKAESATSTAAPKRRKKRKKTSKNDFSAPITGMIDEPEETAPIKISAIDELMENTDWFVAPDPVPLKKDPEVEENFGYKEPQKRNETPDDDRQLTLW